MSDLDWVSIPAPQDAEWYKEALEASATLFNALTRSGFTFTAPPELDPVEAYFAADLIGAE